MSDLIPVDVDRCQAMKPNGANFMTFGGVSRMVRCDNKPLYIATEKVAGSDGLKGSMSVCQTCMTQFMKQGMGDKADIESIEVKP